MPSRPEKNDQFGRAVAVGDMTGDGRADVLTGAIGYEVRGIADAGAVLLLPGSAQGLTGAGSVMLTQNGPGAPDNPLNILGPAETLDYFGQSTAILDLDGVGSLDMLVASSFDGATGQMAELDPVYVTMRPRGTKLVGLVPVRVWTGRDLGAYSAGHTLLHR
ncbi:FG-GAP repeat protein [Phytomonospora endophytica]|uniref:FG-GAP repeat protein n=1 Tax=Phytomonospora endophytica TaxID=714109 RepID=A0A841FS81_9ACTN|nr:FG-GAP repeat protein [Phytomonospora endophytica]MBB6036167.1 hypothetical protein [Phytomonospora endophytica]GIG67071.1 hypothetical protein Pen01_33660 [Phytomonospora endophytica]